MSAWRFPSLRGFVGLSNAGAPRWPAPTRHFNTIPGGLTSHNCINLRLPTHGGLYAWEFEKAGREMNVRVDGQLVLGTGTFMLMAARAGFGLAYLPEEEVRSDLESGRLIRVLADWCPPFSGYHLYYPSRRQPTQAFALLVDALRYRAP
jgi:DNA-binding transcriptional LysR family regulator